MIKNIVPAFTEAGKIKLGGLGDERTSRSGGKYRVPVKYDEFVITKTYRDATGDLVEDEELARALDTDNDGKLRAIPIVLHSDNIEDVFPTSYAYYSGKKLYCSGDGETATRWEIKDNKRTGAKKETKCTCPFLDERKCKPHGTLHCSIRVPGLAVAGAIHTFRTTSIISIRRVIGSLTQIQKAVGMLQNLPLWLVVQPVVVAPDGAQSSTVYCAHIELRAADVIEAQRGAIEAARIRTQLVGEMSELNQRYRAMLRAPASADELDDEQAVINEEFSPETVIEAAAQAESKSRVEQVKARLRRAAPPEQANADGGESWADVGPPAFTDEEAKAAEDNAVAATAPSV